MANLNTGAIKIGNIDKKILGQVRSKAFFALVEARNLGLGMLKSTIKSGGDYVIDHRGEAYSQGSINKWEASMPNQSASSLKIAFSNQARNKYNKKYVQFLIDKPYKAKDQGLTEDRVNAFRQFMVDEVKSEIKKAKDSNV